ncbi:hypothetical protein BKN38_01810 [Helicobacter sp. CLO-3]|uniref:hypothetical protein n=1 Tax=unclassified Helicobacter TaxID=2593540 RepID=UPI000806036C|nr:MULTISPECIES: hypothetical protein [unclassified Helicobacter]OBV28956.1 hypothetical protein BA723_01120 [Helicobacter sp. CLO-3]OHU84801.1 hypothetical protein BKN38_01810 [Helicobacter sp. CLO-3]
MAVLLGFFVGIPGFGLSYYDFGIIAKAIAKAAVVSIFMALIVFIVAKDFYGALVAIFIGEVIGIFTPASNFSIGFAFAPETFPVFVIVEVISLIIFLDIVHIIIKKSWPNEALIINIKKYRRINFIFLFFISMSFAGAIFSYGAAYLAFRIMGSFFRDFYIALFITTCMTIFFY